MKIDLKALPNASLGFIEPMLAKAVDSLPTKGNWLYEVELDRYRALVVKRRGQVTLFSRRGNALNRRFPALPDAFDFLPEDSILDGEICFGQ
jgi:bifunctional non-homologous end joining protein LigD